MHSKQDLLDHSVVHGCKEIKMILVLFSICLFNFKGVFCDVSTAEDGKSGTISFTPPTLNDEEAHAIHIPRHLKCDACVIIAYKLKTAFDTAHAKRKSVKQLAESDVLKIVEDTCKDKFEQYGIKEVKKVKRLSGPGLDTEDVPGVMQGGGKWPERLQRFCHAYVEELDDSLIYVAYLQDRKDLSQFMCRNPQKQGMTDVCGKQTKPVLKSKSMKKAAGKRKDEL